MINLTKCKQISVEFHSFRDYFNVTKKDIETIKNRLKKYFKIMITGEQHPDILFIKE